jgi:hypothetical protein
LSEATALVKNGNHQLAKQLLEAVIREYADIMQEPSINMLCGEINMALGYLIIAE